MNLSDYASQQQAILEQIQRDHHHQRIREETDRDQKKIREESERRTQRNDVKPPPVVNEESDFMSQQQAILEQIQRDHHQQRIREVSDGDQKRIREESERMTQRNDVKPPPVVSEEEEVDFTAFLKDDGFVQRQREILQKLQLQDKPVDNVQLYSTPTATHMDRILVCAEEASLLSSQIMPVEKNTAPRDNIVASSSQDRITRMSTGKTVNMKGIKHTYQAIEQGKATIVHCINCQAVLQVPEACKSYFCTVCNHISPMRQKKNVRSSATDDRIANSLQQHELDVACARKASAYSSSHAR
jgi:hypothetical protein